MFPQTPGKASLQGKVHLEFEAEQKRQGLVMCELSQKLLVYTSSLSSQNPRAWQRKTGGMAVFHFCTIHVDYDRSFYQK